MNKQEKNNQNNKEIEGEVIDNKEQEAYNQLSKDELILNLKEFTKELSSIKDKNLNIIKEKDDWQDKYTRLQAEFENTQKRWEKSREHLKQQYIGMILKSFLPLYDSFKNALKNEDENSPLNQFYKQFLNILKSHGAEPMKVEELELFNYDLHEALSTIERDDVPNNSIIEIIQDGIKLNKDILRFAKVIISRTPKPPEPESKEINEEDIIEEE